ncbi:MAG: iron-containing alcohol dehydrogenase [Bacteroidia bacterium]|nr:iron-containing alcohol dehydrogenase [Bacteroidia bacterium]
MFNNIYTYNFPTPIRFGAGAIKELGPYLKAEGLSRPLLVTDAIVRGLPFFAKIVADLEAQGFSIEVFSEMHKNPIKSDVLKGDAHYKATNRDSVVGIGGGVPLDVARAIVLRVNHTERDLLEYDDLLGGDKYVTNSVPHFVTVPTTSGTGSEVGRSAIISEDESKKKRILFHPKLMARKVFADPELTFDMPPFVTAATGMDAFTHNIEAYLAKGYHPMADGIALQGIQMITESIEKATHNPDLESRSKMLLGSLMGAVAFQKGLGVVHSLAHPLSSLLDMHHGLANAINLPYGMKFNIPGQEARFAEIARAMGIKGGDGNAVVNALFELNDKLGLPRKLSGAGVKPEHIQPLADLALADFCHPSNPRPVTRQDFVDMYTEAIM